LGISAFWLTFLAVNQEEGPVTLIALCVVSISAFWLTFLAVNQEEGPVTLLALCVVSATLYTVDHGIVLECIVLECLESRSVSFFPGCAQPMVLVLNSLIGP